jgi:hypothetical protein
MGDDPWEIDEMVHIDSEDSEDSSLRVLSAGNSKEFETDDYMNLFSGTSDENSSEEP